MPIIHVHMLEGRDDDQKRALARELTDAFTRTCGSDAANVRVVIDEVQRRHWAIGGVLVADQDG